MIQFTSIRKWCALIANSVNICTVKAFRVYFPCRCVICVLIVRTMDCYQYLLFVWWCVCRYGICTYGSYGDLCVVARDC